jgi:hypothetical protein
MPNFNEDYLQRSETEQENIRASIRQLLESAIIQVTFIKKDGTERVMKCSNHAKFMPAVDRNSKKQSSAEAVTVWDIEADDWRSFRYDRVRSLKLDTYIEHP